LEHRFEGFLRFKDRPRRKQLNLFVMIGHGYAAAFSRASMANGTEPVFLPGTRGLFKSGKNKTHTLSTGSGYWVSIESVVSSKMPPVVACANRMRSKGSLWMGGKFSTARA